MEITIKWIKRVVLSTGCLLLMISWNAYGQDPEPIEIPNNYPEMGKIRQISEANKALKEELDKSDLNRITLQQMGEMNEAFIMQFSDSDPILAIVHQKGDENNLNLVQQGNNNASDIRQKGYANAYSGIHDGENIISRVIQNGNGNYIEQLLEGDGMDFLIKQNGNNNEVFQEYIDSPTVGYKVFQKGDNMSITIKQDQVFGK